MIYEKNQLRKISFPLGGIGTGSVGLAGNGSLLDWEIFNHPNKQSRNGYSHFALRVRQNGRTLSKVLQGDCTDEYGGTLRFGEGVDGETLAGLPHFRSVRFDGRFPIADLTLSEEGFPIVARLTAFNPLIPHDEYNSGLPAAFFEWELENVSALDAECALGFSLCNPAGVGKNEAFLTNGMQGMLLQNLEVDRENKDYFDLCMLSDGADTVAEECWFRGRWKDGLSVYWRNFTEADRMPARSYPDAGKRDTATLVSYLHVPARACRRVRFLMAWNMPNMYNDWSKNIPDEERGPWKHYYATQFASSRATAEYAMAHFGELYEKTKVFADALQESSLPDCMIDAISANLSVLKSPTVMRLTDGSLWGWEGVHKSSGSCEGSCQHVWNYAYALPFLFPRLERSLRNVTIKYALAESGKSSFRVLLPIGRGPWSFRACVDGQMGEVIKCYREWKISGDTDWLRANASAIFSMLEYAWSEENPDRWDADMDGVMEGRQHHTLDMELFGPNAWLQGFYLLALDCGAKMADAIGDTVRAAQYRTLYEKGKAWTNEHLFNGKYFAQRIDLSDRSILDRFDDGTERNVLSTSDLSNYWNDEAKQIKYQIADGCIIDQMLADWHGALIGADPVFDPEKKRIALESLYRNNFKPTMREVANMWRNFAVDDEGGTVICSYPDGVEKPIIPIPYCEETMTGFEYALAGLMAANGYTAECMTMVGAIRNRYDGEKRNPWNEIECGNNYARSMASYALMPIMSGFSFDMTRGYVGFNPAVKGDGQYVWSVGNTWGTVRFYGKRCALTVLGEPLVLSSFGLRDGGTAVSVKVDGKPISFMACNGGISFAACAVKSELTVEV